MSQLEIIRRQQLIGQAEGYLDLIMCLENRWPLSTELVISMTNKAFSALDKLDANSGRRSHVAFLQGQAFRVRGEFDRAISAYWESLETDSENIHTHLGLAWCCKRIGELELAIESLSNAFSLEPENPVICYNLACYWSLAGNVDQCCDYLQRALELDGLLRDLIDDEPDFDPVRSHLQFLSVTSVVV